MIYKVSERPVIIVIGQQGENDAENIQVDYTEWIEKYGSGIITAEYQRPDMSYPYPVTLTMADGIATWTVSETDVTWEDSENGSCGKMTGFVQLVYKAGEIVKKTVIWPVQVNKSLGASGPVPDPVQSWIDQMVELGAVVAENAAKAEQAAADAESYAEAAKASADNADAAAEAAAASAEAAATAKSAAETAQAAAEAARAAAEQARSEAEAAETGAEAAQASAEAAAQSATAAQNAAEAARDAAQAAQTAAEAARDAAQQYAEEAAEAAVNALIPFLPVDSASGAIASFPDGANDIPVISLTAEIEPVQDLNGYANPWPAGGGKNLIGIEDNADTVRGITVTQSADGTIVLNGTVTGSGDNIINIKPTAHNSYTPLTDIFPIKADVQYKLFGCPSGGSTSTYRLQLLVYGSGQEPVDVGSGSSAFSFTQSQIESMRYRLAIRLVAGLTCNNLTFKPMVILASETDTSFVPYSNECPISGHTGVTVERTGANIWDEEWESGQYNGNPNTGVITKAADNTRIRSKNDIPVKENTTYYVFANQPLFAYFLDKDKNWMNRVGSNGTTLGKNATFTTPEGCAYIKFFTVNTAAYDKNISINYPSTDHDYHAYQGETIPVSWESEAGTVYGGELDVVSGELNVTTKKIKLGDLNWRWQANGSFYLDNYNSVLDDIKIWPTYYHTLNWLSNTFSIGTTNSTPQNDGEITQSINSQRLRLRWDGIQNDAEALKTWLTEIDAELVYELAEPIEYTLTPQEVRTFLGQNNIWNDVGDTEVMYRADIAKYIEKKVNA